MAGFTRNCFSFSWVQIEAAPRACVHTTTGGGLILAMVVEPSQEWRFCLFLFPIWLNLRSAICNLRCFFLHVQLDMTQMPKRTQQPTALTNQTEASMADGCACATKHKHKQKLNTTNTNANILHNNNTKSPLHGV
jgi:hypothetical protein